eukprot:TRINITY_DN2056_c0_g3_i1.p2 TRINITY_DN2056_c0_g3~~TRINITY_DN2056_c0_g3_i1.p2  ORF type:complete len:216 (+),score=132.93 TRINITY_DN2056_c0_g3_i1:57-650(+)
MPLAVPPLPYAASALTGAFSEEQVAIHHGKHVAGYCAKINAMVAGTADDGLDLAALVARAEPGTGLANCAFQVVNHDTFFKSMAPDGGGDPTGKLAELVAAAFGSADALREKMSGVGAAHFGSGWAFLVQLQDGSLAVRDYHDAGTPFRDTEVKAVLLALDLWEHSYYVDFRQDRAAYIKAYWTKVNWGFAAANLKE